MPVYTYRCPDCGVKFIKKEESHFGVPLRRCPACYRGRVLRNLQLPAIVFNGTGLAQHPGYEKRLS
jgi:putative FmdB family regulatory protein